MEVASDAETSHAIMSTRTTYSSMSLSPRVRYNESAAPCFVGASGVSIVHIRGAFAAAWRGRISTRVAPGESADTVATSAIVTVTVAPRIAAWSSASARPAARSDVW
eukprot:scaffold90334_cov66-Phaeocystis_antarctica.AAC.2